MRRLRRLLCLAVGYCAAIPILAQQSPFLPEETYTKLVNEISGHIAYDSLRTLAGGRSPNSLLEKGQRLSS